MCRMFGFIGPANFASTLQRSLVSAAEFDDFLKEKERRHKDGWGAIMYSPNEEKEIRSTVPIFEDVDKALGFFGNGTGRIAAISHARAAAVGEPVRGFFDSHPFRTHIGEELIILSHNGHIDKTKLQGVLGDEIDVQRLNDSEVFTYLLEREQGTVEERLRQAIQQVRNLGPLNGALNLFVLSIDRDGRGRLYYHSDFPERGMDLYYSLYALRNETTSAVMSSTVAFKARLIDKLGEPTSPEVERCERGALKSFHFELLEPQVVSS